MRIRWRGLELPTRVIANRDTLTRTYGDFTVEPFERGFGTTVGNSLRRILLSSLEGSAVTTVRIEGVQHEFSTIPGVVEDVTDILLNIKGVVVKNYSDRIKTIRIDKAQAGVVTAADIVTDDNVEVFNRDLIIATLTEDVPFQVEMTVANGRGYRTASENTGEEQPIGVIAVDSIFSPVVRVRYKVEDTRVGQRVNYDKLHLEIWTDGTVTPEMALVEAAKILRKHLNPFVQYFEMGAEVPVGDRAEVVVEASEPIDADLESKLGMSIAELDLSVRASNCLESENISSVKELVMRSEADMLKVRNFGKTSLREIKKKLSDMGLSLGMQLPSSN